MPARACDRAWATWARASSSCALARAAATANGWRSSRNKTAPASTWSFWSTRTSVTNPATRGLTLVRWADTNASSVETVSSLLHGRNAPANDRENSQAHECRDHQPAHPVALSSPDGETPRAPASQAARLRHRLRSGNQRDTRLLRPGDRRLCGGVDGKERLPCLQYRCDS